MHGADGVVGAALRTVDQLHDDCRMLLDTLDARRYERSLRIDADGRMTSCGGNDPMIADGPGEFVSIGDFTIVD